MARIMVRSLLGRVACGIVPSHLLAGI